MDKYGLNGYKYYYKMLDQEKLDAVYICIPPFAHKGQEVEIANRGLALFVEKPICLDLSYAQKTEHVISSQGVINACGYMFRYLDIVDKAKEIIGSSPIVIMRGSYFSPIPHVSWWRQIELSGGQIVEQATHVVDLMRYFAGEVSRISGEGFLGAVNDIEDYDLYDATSLTFRFKNGAIANLTTTCVLTNEYRPGLEIVCRGNHIFLDLLAEPAKLIQQDGVNAEFVSKDDLFFNEDKAFIQAILTNDQSLIRSDYADATKTLELTLAAQEVVTRSLEDKGIVLTFQN
jgi:predicted dehydrogenase